MAALYNMKFKLLELKQWHLKEKESIRTKIILDNQTLEQVSPFFGTSVLIPHFIKTKILE